MKLTLSEPLEDYDFTAEEAAWWVDADNATRRAVARSRRQEVVCGFVLALILVVLFWAAVAIAVERYVR